MGNPATTFIYTLKDPRTGEVRYVGKANDPVRRLKKGHLRKDLLKDTHKDRWLRILFDLNLVPELEILEECSYEIWEERERHYINIYDNLTNMTEGGDSGLSTAEVARKISISMREFRKRNGTTEAQREAARKNGSLSRGRKHRESTKKLMSRQRRGRVSPRKGSTQCARVRRKISESLRGNAHTRSMKKSIIQYTLRGERVETWPSASDAARETGFCRSTLSRCAREKRASAYGFVWRYAN